MLTAFCALTLVALVGCCNKNTVTKYTVSFKNYDGSLLSEIKVKKGETAVYEGPDPLRAETTDYTYTFNGWDQSLENITSNCVRVAQYTETLKPVTVYYTVTFQNYDGTVITTDRVVAGGTAVFTADEPTRAETAEYSYEFDGWDKPLSNITSDCVRVAQFTETAKPITIYYTVSFQNYDGTVLTTDKVEKDGTATYSGITPTRPETVEFSYTFNGWDKPLTNITGDCVRVAQFTENQKQITKYYTVTFKNYDGTILHETSVKEGGTATYSGQTPTRLSTPETSFTFTGWDEPLTNITSDCVRVAQYTEEYIEYTVRFLNYDNELLYVDTVHYQEAAHYRGVTPTKPATETRYYTFKGWDRDFSSITASMDVKAVYDEHGDERHILLNPNNGEDSYEKEVALGESYDLGTPSFPGFIFLGWYDGETQIDTTGTWTYSGISGLKAKWQNVYFVFAENTDHTYTVSLNSDGKALSEIDVPSAYEGVAVTALEANFLKSNTIIEKITIPGSIKDIPEYSFYSCTKLKEVTLKDGILTIGQFAFDNCKLEKLILPNTCTTIGSRAFDDNGNLYHLYIPESVKTVGSYAFDVLNGKVYICLEHESIPSGFASNWTKTDTYAYYTFCTKLVEGEDYNYVIRNVYNEKSVTILRLSTQTSKLASFVFPLEIEGISTIKVGRSLFQDNKYIQNVDFTGVNRINDSAFYNCTNLQTITFSNSLTYIGNSAFRFCSSLTRVEIPNSVSEIANLAFDTCKNLEYVYIPGSVDTIGNYAFDECNKSTIYTTAHSSSSWSSNWKGSQPVYYDFVSLDEVDDFNYVVQYFAEHYYVTITGLKESAKTKPNITIPDQIEGISDIRLKDGLFNSFTELVSVNLGQGVKSVSSSCFRGCTKLETVVLGNNVTNIGGSAFYNCSKLTSINMPNSLTTIGSQAFDFCSSLREIEIPINVSTIGTYAFDDISKLVFLIAANTSQSGWTSTWYGANASGRTFIYSYISSGVVGDFKYAKSNNGAIDTVYITGLANDSTNLNLVIPDEIEGITNIKIASYAFSGKTLIKSIDLGNSVKAINRYAFSGCTSLRSVIIPLSCITIEEYAFQSCSTECLINCEASSKPDGWASTWVPSTFTSNINWGYVRP